MSTRNIGILLILGSSSMSSLGTVFKVMGLKTVDPIWAASVGVTLAGVILTALIYILGYKFEVGKIIPVLIPLIMLIMLRPILSNMLYTFGMAQSSAIKATMLTKMEPYAIILWAWVLDKHTPKKSHIILLCIHVIGAVLLSIGWRVSWDGRLFADILMLLAVFSAGLSYRFVSKVTESIGALQTNAVVETIGGILTLPIALFFVPIDISPDTHEGWLYLLAHLILFNLFALSFWYAAIPKVEHSLASALRAVGPILVAPVAWIFFGERLDSLQILGASIVLATSAGLCLQRNKC